MILRQTRDYETICHGEPFGRLNTGSAEPLLEKSKIPVLKGHYLND
tara:strand:- start:23784 stop:23921 length:138 start_codon:yes stop_codon:yes gene_type:complete